MRKVVYLPNSARDFVRGVFGTKARYYEIDYEKDDWEDRLIDELEYASDYWLLIGHFPKTDRVLRVLSDQGREWV